ncbi:metallophosphoesterase [Candidatus Woesearchaeota archaeon]|nr:metallophosphoesterase [Candidatus Woesearchaeota archaeon]
MEISQGIEIVDLGLFVKKAKMLVVSDIHLGIEEEYQKRGTLVPKFHLKDLLSHFEYIFSKIKPKTILITGDLKHEFGRISEQEWRDLLRLFDYLSKHCEKIILLKGNHDPFLGPIANKRNLELKKEHVVGNILFVHGNYEPKLNSKIKTIVMGHEHPAITLREKTKAEKFKCFVKTKYKGRELIIQPSMNTLIEGTDISQRYFISPLLKGKKKFEVFVVENNEVYDFGKI